MKFFETKSITQMHENILIDFIFNNKAWATLLIYK